MSIPLSPAGQFDIWQDNGLSHLNQDVEDPPVMASVGVVAPVTMFQARIADGETLADFTRRMYGANTYLGREMIRNANDEMKGLVNVPAY